MEGSPRQQLSAQTREVIFNVHEYFKREKENKTVMHGFDKAVQRTMDATKQCRSTIYRICKEGKDNLEENEAPVFNVKKRKRPPTVTNIDGFDQCVLRRTVLGYYVRKEIPTLDSILLEVKENIGFSGCRESLRKILKEIGFKYGRVNGRKFLLERSDIASARTKFLREMKNIRGTGNKSVIFLDETWINQNYTVTKCWMDESSTGATGINPPSGKGSRIIILHAGSEQGFVPNAQLVFQAKNDGDYHHQMNHIVFEKWFREQLIPNIPQQSVIIMDNASYHSVQSDKPPTMASTKGAIQDWLRNKGENPPEYLTKCELLEMVKAVKRGNAPKYVIDKIALEKGHRVVRLPPYHCHYSAIELIWAQVKNFVAKRNTFKMADLTSLLQEALSCVTAENWKNAVTHVENIIIKDTENDVAVNQFVDSFVIEVTSSDEE
ncbi:uncharacterized protein LOC135199076 [Macrobrachium nipponense]|uniref:uncharacterized protein LOC135199076 n=1 Tax=Macrobrachium nipponense TaxID=159736 RepID=UPI0030C7E83F